jgi:hypothetical protein
MSLFSVPVVRYGQLYQVETVAETAQEAVAQAAANTPGASAVAAPLNVAVVQPVKSHGHRWPPT